MNNEKGVVLLITLLIVSILTVITLEFFSTAYVDLSIAGNHRDDLKMEYIARAGVNAGKALLIEDKKGDMAYDSMDEIWAQEIPYPVGDGLVILKITDEERKINLNSLIKNNDSVDDKSSEMVMRLFEILDIEPELLDCIIDWIDSNDNPYGDYGVERDYYMSLKRPYPAKNKKMDTIQELLLIKGITPEIFYRLEPFFTVTSSEKININTAPKEILQSLSEEITENIAEEIVVYRQDTPFEKKDNIKNVQGINDKVLNKFNDLIDVKSEYFLIKSTAIVNEAQRTDKIISKRSETDVTFIYWITE